MKLKEYLSSADQSATHFAEQIGTSPAFLYQVSTGRRSCPVQWVKTIKGLTNGAVSEIDLRPDDWHLIWPDLSHLAPQKVA